MKDIIITVEEDEKLFLTKEKKKKRKAAAPDKIPSCLLQPLAKDIAPAVSYSIFRLTQEKF